MTSTSLQNNDYESTQRRHALLMSGYIREANTQGNFITPNGVIERIQSYCPTYPPHYAMFFDSDFAKLDGALYIRAKDAFPNSTTLPRAIPVNFERIATHDKQTDEHLLFEFLDDDSDAEYIAFSNDRELLFASNNRVDANKWRRLFQKLPSDIVGKVEEGTPTKFGLSKIDRRVLNLIQSECPSIRIKCQWVLDIQTMNKLEWNSDDKKMCFVDWVRNECRMDRLDRTDIPVYFRSDVLVVPKVEFEICFECGDYKTERDEDFVNLYATPGSVIMCVKVKEEGVFAECVRAMVEMFPFKLNAETPEKLVGKLPYKFYTATDDDEPFEIGVEMFDEMVAIMDRFVSVAEARASLAGFVNMER